MAYTKYSLTPANNNAAPPDGAPEGMLPSAVNDTMRDMMAQIRDVGDGIRGGTYTMTAPVITGGSINGAVIGGSTPAAISATSLTDSGNLTFTSTGQRILGDFSNGTIANRVAFQSSTVNGGTGFTVIPNGTGVNARFQAYNNSDPTNASQAQLSVEGSSEVSLRSGITGTGTYLPLTFYTGGSERMRIDTSGNLLVGCTANTNSGGFILYKDYDAANSASLDIGHITGSASGNRYTRFQYAGSTVGSITQSGTTSVAYNTSSDYRLKENIAPMKGALDVVQQLKPVTYNWKADGSSGQGFIAHELQAVVPECVTGEKDAVDAEGNPVYQGIDTSFLVATLTKAIQEQQSLITQLQADVALLKGN